MEEGERINVRTQSRENGGKRTIEIEQPYVARVTITGTADILFHAWNSDAVAAKAAAPRGSKAKKEDDIESYVYRTDEGMLAIPGENLRQALINAARFKTDPRSARKTAVDLFKAGVQTLTPFASIGTARWDYEDRRRVVIKGNGITRVRPAMRAGWTCEFDFLVPLPEYISPVLLQEVLAMAGRVIGLCGNRPTNGRFLVTKFETGLES